MNLKSEFLLDVLYRLAVPKGEVTSEHPDLSHEREVSQRDQRFGHVSGMERMLANLPRVQLEVELEWCEEQLNSAEKSGVAVDIASCLNAKGIILERLDRLDVAKSCYERSVETSLRIRDSLRALAARHNLAYALMSLGDIKEARRHAERMREELPTADASHFEACAYMLLSQISSLEQKTGEARDFIEKALLLLTSPADVEARLWALSMKAGLAAADRQYGEAADVLEATLRFADRPDAPDVKSIVFLMQGVVAAKLGENRKALAHLEEASLLARKYGPDENLWKCHLAAARIHRGRQQWDKVREEYEAAMAIQNRKAALLSCEYKAGYLNAPWRWAVVQEFLDLDTDIGGQRETASVDEESGRREEGATTFAEPLKTSSQPSMMEVAYRRILEINRTLATRQETEPLLDLIVDSSIELTRAERGFLMLCENGDIQFKVARKFDRQKILRPEFEVSYTIAKDVIREGKAMITANAQLDERMKDASSVAELDLKSVLCAPLKFRGRILGAIYLERRYDVSAFSETDRELLEVFAAQASIAIENARLLQESVVDRLTHLYFHNHFVKVADDIISRLVEDGQNVALCLMDIDRFKLINDVYGHGTGNQAMREISRILLCATENLPSMGGRPLTEMLVGRYGGDEFEFLISRASTEEVAAIAENIRKTVEEHAFESFMLPTADRARGHSGAPMRKLSLTVSIGFAVSPDDGVSFAELLQKADEALYNAKRSGRNGVCASAREPKDDRAGKRAISVSRDINSIFLSRDQMAFVGMITKVVNAEMDPDRLLELVTGMSVDVTKAERGFAMLVTKDGELEFKVARNTDGEQISSPEFETSRTLINEVVSTGTPVMVENALDDVRLKDIDSVELLQLRSVLCVPICADQRVVGLIYLDNRHVSKRFTEEDLALISAFASQVARPIMNSIAFRRQEEELLRMREQIKTRYSYANIIGKSKAMLELFGFLDRVVGSNYPVLIEGETGTGKELVANAIHYNGDRKEKPFVAVNCSALSESLLEAELFGYVKGAFTGAAEDRAGLFEEADGGTMFLDEIGDMSLKMQSELLRVLQNGEIRRVGGKGLKRVDVRVIAASNRNLKELVEKGTFRADLYYRINVVRIVIPPLRERKEDIPLLADHFLSSVAGDRGKLEIAPDAMKTLLSYQWPGNVRELRNSIERAALICDGHSIRSGHVILDAGTPSAGTMPAPLPATSRMQESTPSPYRDYHLDDEQQRVMKLLDDSGRLSTGKVQELLGISRTSAWRCLTSLVENGLIRRVGKGRSIWYAHAKRF